MADMKRNPGLKYSQLGNTDMVVSNISLGGAAFGNVYKPMEQTEVDQVVKLAIESGINYIDTAPWYGQGQSEQRLGTALKNIPRQQYYLATKVGRYNLKVDEMFDFSTKKITDSFDKSLELLQVDYVDLIQVHDVEFSESMSQLINHTLPALQELKRQGKARYVGITGYTLQILKDVVRRAPPGSIDVVLSYCRMNMTNQDLEEYMDFFKSQGIGVVNASAVGMGLLAGPDVPEWHIAPRPIKEAAMKAWNLCQANGQNLATLAIEWVFCQHHLTTTLMSIADKEQLRQNLETAVKMAKPGAKQELVEANQVFRKAKAIFDDLLCTNWDAIDIAQYWEKMHKGSFRQNQDP